MRLKKNAKSRLLALNAGFLCGCVGIIYAIADTALIFSGPLESYVSVGLGLCLFGGAGLALIGAWRSSFDGVILGSQEVTVLFVALMIADLNVDPSKLISETQLLPTAIAIITCSSLTLGVTFFAVGKYRLGTLARFMPYPVIAGFLAGTGLLLAINSVSVIILGGNMIPSVLAVEPAMKLLLSLVLVAFLAWSTTQRSAAALLPAGVICAIVLCHLLLSAAGFLGLQANSWLFSMPEKTSLWPAINFAQLADIHWLSLLYKLPDMLSLALVASLALMMKLYATEKIVGKSGDFNNELTLAGVANLCVAAGGGMPGFHSLSGTAIVNRMNGSSWLVGVTASIVIATPLLIDSSFVALLPRPVFGAVLLWIGLDLTYEWLFKQYSRIPRADFSIILLITGVIAFVGFTEGVAIGFAAASIYFIVDVSRTNVIRQLQTGAELRSGSTYCTKDTNLLNDNGHHIIVIRLHGHMFFGTAYQLEQQLNELVTADPMSALRHIIIDCKNVSGIDLSAAQRLVDLLSNADSVDSRYGNIVLCCLQSGVSDGRASKEFQEKLPTKLFDDLNRALEWAECHLLKNLHKQSIKTTDKHTGNILVNSDMDLLLDLDINRELSQYCRSVTVSAGEFLIHAGQEPDSLYVVEEGRLNILISNADNTFFCVRSLGEGMILGEIPLYLGGQRSASVQAESNCKVWKLTYVQLHELEKQHSSLAAAFHKTIAATLAARLKDSNRVIRLVS